MAHTSISPDEFAALADSDETLRPWRYALGSIVAEFRAADFPAAGAFASTVAVAAEQAHHHPDLVVRYPGVVTITITTHDAGSAVTELDVDLASTITRLAESTDAVHPSPPTDAAVQVVGFAADADTPQPRYATRDDAAAIGRLLDAFNTEYGAPTPGPTVLAQRLERLLLGSSMFAIVAGDPIIAIGLVSLRPNVWHDGRVALLDELYVVPAARNRGIGTAIITLLAGCADSGDIDAIEINVDEGDHGAQRFYERNGYTATDPDTGERAHYYYRMTER